MAALAALVVLTPMTQWTLLTPGSVAPTSGRVALTAATAL